jgi:hypothetical protein
LRDSLFVDDNIAQFNEICKYSLSRQVIVSRSLAFLVVSSIQHHEAVWGVFPIALWYELLLLHWKPRKNTLSNVYWRANTNHHVNYFVKDKFAFDSASELLFLRTWIIWWKVHTLLVLLHQEVSFKKQVVREVNQEYLVKLPHIFDLLEAILWPFPKFIQGFFLNNNAGLLLTSLRTDFCLDNARFDFFELVLGNNVFRDDLSESD